jgi:hypothetical protein
MPGNKNVSIIETDGGRALEITSGGELVWHYRNRYRAGRDRDLVANVYSL